MTRQFPLTDVDHNTPSPDILFALRDSHQDTCPFLSESVFDDLSENYAAEEPEDFLDAMGQELTCFEHVLYELFTDSDSDFVPVGGSRVAFQVRPKSVPRGKTESRLTLLDLATGKESYYPCNYGYVRKWTNNRICVLPIDVTSKMPIIECFDFDSGEKKNLMYGALGKDSVYNIYEALCGTVLVGREKNIYRTTGLWDFMEEAKD